MQGIKVSVNVVKVESQEKIFIWNDPHTIRIYRDNTVEHFQQMGAWPKQGGLLQNNYRKRLREC